MIIANAGLAPFPHAEWQQPSESRVNNFPCSILRDEVLEMKNTLLFARPMNKYSVLSFVMHSDDDKHRNCMSTPAVLATQDSMVLKLQGEWIIEIFPMSQITTLFSFLDYQERMCGRLSGSDNDVTKNLAAVASKRSFFSSVKDRNNNFFNMLISYRLRQREDSIDDMFTFVRNIESYWIAYFLLSQLMSDEKSRDMSKIYNVCKIYGVSESYFRKLCNNAFSCGPKKQLRLWRAASSALQLIEKNKSISIVAGDNGYASSSHFSSEIKSLFGITPREFKRLEGFLHE
ncbi:helix-turn-helix domain-containing protein [Pectobacterium carotovorum]|uniref:Helix-turn-helix domain-containing protein n=1 Tax=Pectobacterium carotovorum TaxID=554 RepID=A0A419ASD5_PECCA|nr:helix-turn-helix domain-containing protein [Pectobacterium carotovorum]RJL48609.1 helix-turn-helix domain-containing protein [Pectobacterium carotovorum]